MGSETSGEPGVFVGRLANQARKLQNEAKAAIAQGDYARASALIGDAELLAEDVHGLVDDIEHRQTDRLMGHAAAEAEARRPRRHARGSRVRLAMGATLAISLALVEC